MSSISAGTTTGTALVSTGDTTGELVLKTNGTTTAVTIGTNQVVTLAQALPAGSGGTGLTSPGTSGNVLTSNGSAWVSSTPTSIGGGGNVTTDNLTLTSSSAADQYVTPSAHGFYVKLPDATTLSEGSGLYNIHNNSNFFYGIENNAGTTLCFVAPYSSVTCSLADNSTSNGTWNFVNQEQLGTAAQAIVTLPSSTSSNLTTITVVNLDSRYQVIVFNTTAAVYAVVYDNTNNVFGSVTLVRTASFSSQAITPLKVSATSLLVASCNTTTALEVVLLSVSGTTITVNTAATATLGSNFSSFGATPLVLGSSYIFGYSRSSGYGVRAVTVSGTTVTIGAESGVGSGAVASVNLDRLSATEFIHTIIDYGTTQVSFIPHTVSGSTLTAGTAATVSTAEGVTGFYVNNGRLMCVTTESSFIVGKVISVASNVASASSANLAARGSTASTFSGVAGVAWVGNQMIVSFVQGNNLVAAQNTFGFNVLTNSSGTAVAGTIISTQQVVTVSVGPVLYMAGFDSTSAYFIGAVGAASLANIYIRVGITGNNPEILATRYFQQGASMNIAGDNYPYIETVNQINASYVSAMGNPAKGDFISVLPFSGNTSQGNPYSLRYGGSDVSAYPLKSLKLSNASSTVTGGSPSRNSPISNSYSNSTTLNCLSEAWGVAVVQAVTVGGFSYSKVVLSRLVYA